MFRGLRTVIYHVEDLAGAKQWFAKALGIQPYFDEPYYVGFNVGGFELGLDPDMAGVTEGTRVVSYWGVDKIEEAVRELTGQGATIHSKVQDVGGGIKVATIKDPFGNVIGIIENPHFKIE